MASTKFTGADLRFYGGSVPAIPIRIEVREDPTEYKVGDMVVVKPRLQNIRVLLRTGEYIDVNPAHHQQDAGKTLRVVATTSLNRLLPSLKSQKTIYQLEGKPSNWTSEEFVAPENIMARSRQIDKELAEITTQLAPKKPRRKKAKRADSHKVHVELHDWKEVKVTAAQVDKLASLLK